MRELKFRAWDKEKKEWYGSSNPNQLTWHGFHILGECTMQWPPLSYLENLEITQYTGLRDKNGKEIYEGDIIEFEDTTEDGYEYKEGIDITNRACVVFKDCRYRLKISKRFDLDNIIETTSGVLVDMEEDWELFIDSLKSSKVIGNIYENPELLK